MVLFIYTIHNLIIFREAELRFLLLWEKED